MEALDEGYKWHVPKLIFYSKGEKKRSCRLTPLTFGGNFVTSVSVEEKECAGLRLGVEWPLPWGKTDSITILIEEGDDGASWSRFSCNLVEHTACQLDHDYICGGDRPSENFQVKIDYSGVLPQSALKYCESSAGYCKSSICYRDTADKWCESELGKEWRSSL